MKLEENPSILDFTHTRGGNALTRSTGHTSANYARSGGAAKRMTLLQQHKIQ
jgi:hypothetical protein